MIDKVFDEMMYWVEEIPVLLDLPSEKVFSTEFLLRNISKTEDWVMEDVARRISARKVERIRRAFQGRNADAYLVLYCLHLKEQGKEVVLITDETSRDNDGKIYMKIPKICEIEGVECENIAHYIFSELGGDISVGVRD